jgi:hypothetical protein
MIKIISSYKIIVIKQNLKTNKNIELIFECDDNASLMEKLHEQLDNPNTILKCINKIK